MAGLTIAGVAGAGLSLIAFGEIIGRKSAEFKQEAESTELQRNEIEVIDQDTHDLKGYLTLGAASNNFASLFSKVTTYVVYPLGTGLLAASIVIILTGNLAYITITIIVGAALGALRAHMLVNRDRHVPAKEIIDQPNLEIEKQKEKKMLNELNELYEKNGTGRQENSSMHQTEQRIQTATQSQNKEDPRMQEAILKLKEVEEKGRKDVEQAELEHKQRLEEIGKAAKQKKEEIKEKRKSDQERHNKVIQDGQQMLDRHVRQRLDEIDESVLVLKEQLEKSAQQQIQRTSAFIDLYDRQLAGRQQDSVAVSVSSCIVASNSNSEKLKDDELSVDTLIKILGSDINAKFPENFAGLREDPRTKDCTWNQLGACAAVAQIKNHADFKKDPKAHLKKLIENVGRASMVQSAAYLSAIEYVKRLIELDDQKKSQQRPVQ